MGVRVYWTLFAHRIALFLISGTIESIDSLIYHKHGNWPVISSRANLCHTYSLISTRMEIGVVHRQQ